MFDVAIRPHRGPTDATMKFYLGTHRCNWLAGVGVPLFVSHRVLVKRRSLPVARAAWALDSGGFTELSLHGRWRTSAREYVEAVARYRDEVGRMDWAAPRDWMCEPDMLAATGLTVREHQRRTTDDFLDLRSRRPDLPFIPVLQGWSEGDYLQHVEDYHGAGVDLAAIPLVGIGSVCRRQHTQQIARIISRIASCGINLHAFGVKQAGLALSGLYLASADSMAWSAGARRAAPLAECEGHHRSCSNCLGYALRWRDKIVAQLNADVWTLAPRSQPPAWQPTLPSV